MNGAAKYERKAAQVATLAANRVESTGTNGGAVSKTVDMLQQQLRDKVFHYAQDGKKAAGRALGTIIELITYYKLCTWGFSPNLLIEKRVPEFGRTDIRHNVEFSIHKSLKSVTAKVPKNGRAVTAKMIGAMAEIEITRLNEMLLTSKMLLRNSAVIAEHDDRIVVANLLGMSKHNYEISITELELTPIAIVECKRVGVEEGMKKGPQSIEKAKQGAYVARSVSALQKVVDRRGKVIGVLPQEKGRPIIGDYDRMIARIISSRVEAPQGFVLTVGVTSNHGNWYTAETMNKELKVLAHAYDWLLFLTDEGLLEFVGDCILKPRSEYAPIRKAFLESYDGSHSGNRFTKTRLDLAADQALRAYFVENAAGSDGWFNVITPIGGGLKALSRQLILLLKKRRSKN